MWSSLIRILFTYTRSIDGEKCETRVVGLPDIFDYKIFLSFGRNVKQGLCRTFRPMELYVKKARREKRKERKTRERK